jgi:hypothetical protein
VALTQIREGEGKDKRGERPEGTGGGQKGVPVRYYASMPQIVQEPESLIVRDCLIVLAHSITQIVQPEEPLREFDIM